MQTNNAFATELVNNMSVPQAAKFYVQHGLAVVPDKTKSKQPAISGWVNAKFAESDVDEAFGEESNLSILTGKASGGSVCVDIDSDAALKQTTYLIPTPCVHGRSGMPNSHHWYVIDDPSVPSTQFRHPNGTVLAEILGDKRKVTSPPSTHESGEKIVWEGSGSPTQVPYVALKASVGLMCAAALLAAEWPAKGSRNQASLALAGLLLRSGMDPGAAEQLIRNVAKAANDEEAEDRAACVQATEKKLNQGEPVVGATRLGELIGPQVVERLKEWLNLAASFSLTDSLTLEGDLNVMNERHAVVQLGGSTVVMNEDFDPAFARKVPTFSKPADLRLRHQHKKHVVAHPLTGKPQLRPLADIWLEWPGRRQYAGIEFSPGESTPGYWNRFRGFAIAAKQGNCEPYLKHIQEVICSNNSTHFQYVMRWMAHGVQKPGVRPETALVLRGKQGTGKGVFVEMFGRLFGEHYLTVYKHGQITGRFNAHLMNVLLLHLNEAIWGGHKEAAGMLKGLVTDPVIPIEAKGKDIFAVRNFVRVIVASNESWALPVDLDDRRFLVLDVSDIHKEDLDYFGELVSQMTVKGGLEALMFHLMSMDLTAFDIRKVPASVHALDLKLQSADPIVQWWFHKLKEGHSDTWPLQVPKASLHEEYLGWLQSLKLPHPLTPELFGKWMKTLVPGLESIKITTQSFSGPVRVSCFKLPPLPNCRQSVQNLMKSDEQIWI